MNQATGLNLKDLSEIEIAAERVVARYDKHVRKNDAVKAVALCEDGTYGAFGELIEVVDEVFPQQQGLDNLGLFDRAGFVSDRFSDALEDAFERYQVRLKEELVW
jgi:hypothetical protein